MARVRNTEKEVLGADTIEMITKQPVPLVVSNATHRIEVMEHADHNIMLAVATGRKDDIALTLVAALLRTGCLPLSSFLATIGSTFFGALETVLAGGALSSFFPGILTGLLESLNRFFG